LSAHTRLAVKQSVLVVQVYIFIMFFTLLLDDDRSVPHTDITYIAHIYIFNVIIKLKEGNIIIRLCGVHASFFSMINVSK